MAALGLIVLIVIVLVVLAVLFKYKELRHKFGLVIAAMFFLFVVASVLQVYQNNDKYDLSTFDGVISAGKLYFTWIYGLGENIVRISGYAIHQDWTIQNKSPAPSNSTIK